VVLPVEGHGCECMNAAFAFGSPLIRPRVSQTQPVHFVEDDFEDVAFFVRGADRADFVVRGAERAVLRPVAADQAGEIDAIRNRATASVRIIIDTIWAVLAVCNRDVDRLPTLRGLALKTGEQSKVSILSALLQIAGPAQCLDVGDQVQFPHLFGQASTGCGIDSGEWYDVISLESAHWHFAFVPLATQTFVPVAIQQFLPFSRSVSTRAGEA
jgi:hypothetical protein